jgi:hypothetical protein
VPRPFSYFLLVLWVVAVVELSYCLHLWWTEGWPGSKPEQVVAGAPLEAWGRIGKALQYIGGLVALIDIVGEARLLAFSQALNRHSRRLGAARGSLFEILISADADAIERGYTASSLFITEWFLRIRASGRAIETASGPKAAFDWLVYGLLSGILRFGATVSRETPSLKWTGFLLVTVGFVADLVSS